MRSRFAGLAILLLLLPAQARAARGAARDSASTLLSERPAGGDSASLTRRWELTKDTKLGTFLFRPYQPVYFLPVRYGGRPNDEPSSPTRGPSPYQGLDNVEAKYQLSFKVKAAESLFGTQADLWFAYTQQSHWQVYNGAISRPFRETDYEPEVMLVVPTRYRVLGLSGRLVNLELVHQSNGRSDPLSRSWNRVAAQVGFERGPFALLVRPWYRFREDRESDDNPDLEDYLGHGDVLTLYRWHRRTLSLLLRDNLGTDHNRGTLQLGYSFPVRGRLEGFVQGFWGWGETLIDYNHRETVLGVGVLLIDWM
jgi:phospholipase A1